MSELLQIKHIKQSSELQPRAQMRTEKIDEYTESMKRGDAFPAVTVFKVGDEYYLVDGYHRFMAIQGAKFDKVLADVKTGTMRDAILYSAGVNSTHGIQRTKEDKERAVKILLRDKEWGQWNDTKIAEVAHVSPDFVGKIRKSILPTTEGCTSKKVKVERAGKVYKMDVSKMGKKSEKKPLTQPDKDHPNHDKFCNQPGSLPAETDLPVQPSLAEQIKDVPHASSEFHTASQELAAKKNGIAGEMFPGGNSSEIPKSSPAWTPAACPACPHVVIQKVLGNKCKQTGSLICDMKECPVERRKQMAQEQGFVVAGTGAPSPAGRPITNEHRPLNIIPVQLTKEQAEEAITSVVRGYFTPKSREQWIQLKKIGGWDTDLEALEGLRDDAAERIA